MNDEEFHEWIASMEDQAYALYLLDERYHDHLPEYVNCYLCDIMHAPIWPSELGGEG